MYSVSGKGVLFNSYPKIIVVILEGEDGDFAMSEERYLEIQASPPIAELPMVTAVYPVKIYATDGVIIDWSWPYTGE